MAARVPTPRTAVAIVTMFFDQLQYGNYLGQKAHQKKVQAFAEAAVASDFAELEARFPGRVLLGIGIGHPEATSRYRKPLAAMQAFLGEGNNSKCATSSVSVGWCEGDGAAAFESAVRHFAEFAARNSVESQSAKFVVTHSAKHKVGTLVPHF